MRHDYARKLRINMSVEGELCELLMHWEQRGLVSSAADAVRQGLLALNEKFQTMDERAQRLQTLPNDEED